MKIGITLPQFSDDADRVLDAARRAEELGIDGVFCFDHLWPMGQPGRPALSSGPLLGALAAATSTISIGTLVARIGLLPDPVLISVLTSLANLSAGRFIAGIGTGDSKSREENDAYGVPFDDADMRRRRLEAVATAVLAWDPGMGRRRTTEDGGAGPSGRDRGQPVGSGPDEGGRVACGGDGGHLGGTGGGDRAGDDGPLAGAGPGRGQLGGVRLA